MPGGAGVVVTPADAGEAAGTVSARAGLRHGRTALAAFLVYCALATFYTYPLVRHLGDSLPNDAADPVFNTWLLWWNAHVQPLSAAWWNAPFFHPTPDVTAFSESLLGIGLIASPAQWLGASAPVAYNLAFLLSFPLSALAAFLLCRALTGRRDAAFVGGLAYGFAPYRVGQLAHLQVLSSYWMPLSLLGLHLYLRTRRTRWLVLFGGAFLAQALCTLYSLILLSVLIALWILWFVRSKRDLAGVVAVWALAGVMLLPLLLKYREVQVRFGFDRQVAHIESYAADVSGLLQGSSRLSHGGLKPWVNGEGLLFPGLTVPALVALAAFGFARRASADPPALFRTRLVLAGLAALFALTALSWSIWGPWRIGLGPVNLSVAVLHKPLALAFYLVIVSLIASPRVREARRRGDLFVFYLAAAGAMWLLSLGPSPTFLGMRIWDKAPYWWLLSVPGLSGMRVPARFGMLAVFCLCVAATLALAAVLGRLRSGGRLLVVVAAAGIAWDAWLPRLPLVPVPVHSPLATTPGSDGTVLEMPLGGVTDAAALYRYVDHRRPVVNGYSSYYPPHYLALYIGLERGDDFLSSLPARGPLYVVVDRSRDPWGFNARYVARQGEARRIAATPEAFVYAVPLRPPPTPPRERSLEIRSITASDQPALVNLMTDGDAGTAWATSRHQRKGDWIVVDLGSVQTIGSVVLSLGPNRGDFPRELIIEVSSAGSIWQEVYRGPTAAQAISALIQDPRRAPLRIGVGGEQARYLKLRLGSKDRRHRWAVAEIEVRSPVSS